MPRVHTITETGAVADALDRLRAAGGDESVVIDELVIIGADRKRQELGRRRSDRPASSAGLATLIRNRVPLASATGAEFDALRRAMWGPRPRG